MDAKPRLAGGAPLAAAVGAGDVAGFVAGFAAGFWTFDDVADFGEGRLGTPAAALLVAALPFVLSWKRFEGAIGLAAGCGCSVLTILGCGASGVSSDRLFTPAAALFGTRPLVVRTACVVC